MWHTTAGRGICAPSQRRLTVVFATVRHNGCFTSCTRNNNIHNNSVVGMTCSNNVSSHVTAQRRAIGGLGGKFSRMLDMGGAPSSSNDRTAAKALNLNKNCHLQAVIFDFGLLTQSIVEQQQLESSNSDGDESLATSLRSETASTKNLENPSLLHPQGIVPDVSRIQQVAALLKVDLTGGNEKDKHVEDDQPFSDDLSLILGQRIKEVGDAAVNLRPKPPQPPQQQQQQQQRHAIYQDSANDIRSKYAEKLKRAVGGGVGMVDRTKSEILESDKKGDAAGHFAARAHATSVEKKSTASSSSGTQWMAASGTGQLVWRRRLEHNNNNNNSKTTLTKKITTVRKLNEWTILPRSCAIKSNLTLSFLAASRRQN
jgi:hypothetical protein